MPRQPEGSTSTVLIVDDTRANLVALEATLQPLHYPLVTASSGTEALAYLLNHDCAVILLDVRMPGLGGFETAALIRQRERTRHIPIIFMSAVEQAPTVIRQGYTAGAVDYLLKPVDPDLLRGKVAAFVELRRQNEELHRREVALLRREREVSEAAFRTVVASSPLGLIFSDLSGRVLEANAAFLNLLGYSEEELGAGLIRWTELTPPEWRSATEAAVRDLNEQGHCRPFEKEYFRKDGSRVPVLVGSNRLPDQQRAMTFVLDLTERKRADRLREELIVHEQAARAEAERQRAHLYGLFMQAPTPICITRGVQHLFELANEPFQQLVGRRDLIGGSAREVLAGEGQQSQLETLDQVLNSGELVVRQEVPWNDRTDGDAGSPQQLYSFIYQPLRGPDYRVEGVMMLVFEVTDQVLARQGLETLARELQRAVQIREEFLAIASHELRTPVTSLQLRLQGLMRQIEVGGQELPPSRVQSALQQAILQTRKLIRLVDCLLEVSQIRTHDLELKLSEVDLSVAVRAVLAEIAAEASQAGCALLVDVPEHVVGRWDRPRLEEVIRHLLSNALRYGARRPIHVRVESDGLWGSLSVQDEGPGIDAGQVTQIFEPFERLVTSKDYGGLGLGLYLAKWMVEALGGTLEVTSTVGHGATFTVSLPLAGPPDSRPPSDGLAPSVAIH